MDLARSTELTFEDNQARLAGSLSRITKAFSVSRGDRACLELPVQRKAPVYTADRAWKGLQLGVAIHVIR